MMGRERGRGRGRRRHGGWACGRVRAVVESRLLSAGERDKHVGGAVARGHLTRRWVSLVDSSAGRPGAGCADEASPWEAPLSQGPARSSRVKRRSVCRGRGWRVLDAAGDGGVGGHESGGDGRVLAAEWRTSNMPLGEIQRRRWRQARLRSVAESKCGQRGPKRSSQSTCFVTPSLAFLAPKTLEPCGAAVVAGNYCTCRTYAATDVW